jgi:uncharacterized membrane protein YcaP (DUF421 family)
MINKIAVFGVLVAVSMAFAADSLVTGDTRAAVADVLLAVACIAITRIVQVFAAKIPTVRRGLIGKIIWAIAEGVLGKEVSEQNSVDLTEEEKDRLKAQLKKKYPILREEIK